MLYNIIKAVKKKQKKQVSGQMCEIEEIPALHRCVGMFSLSFCTCTCVDL